MPLFLRRFTACWVFLLLVLAVPRTLPGQMSAQEELRTLRTPPGVKVELFASEPLITNPAAIDVDTHGRVWVAEIRHYRRGPKKPSDSIKVLEDTDGDGRADRVTVFATGLLAPMSICVAGSKVYVATSPDLWVFEDRDGDLRADGPPRKLLTGFGGYNHDHGAHSLVLGPDHKWWMAHGDLGFDVRGTDGSHIKYRWGAVIRGELDGSQLELVAWNFRNPYEVAIDSFGRAFLSDNDNDGNFSVRICWIMPGGNYGWYGRPPMLLSQRDLLLPPGVPFRQAWHFRGHVPGHVPGTLVTGFGSPCGMCVYEGDAFEPAWRGAPWHADAGPREVRVYPHRRRGFGMEASVRNLMTTTGDKYFRPTDVCVAPDGSVFVSDWYDAVVGGHAYNDPDRGRIFRLVPAEGKLARVGKPGPYRSVEDAILGLQNPNLATQFLAREYLLQHKDQALPALKQLVQSGRPHHRARALWVLDRLGGEARQVVLNHLRDEDPRFRALAVRILARHGKQYQRQLLVMSDDPSPAVRCEVLLAMPGMESAASLPVLKKMAEGYSGQDRYELEALLIAARGREKELFDHLARNPGQVLARYELFWGLDRDQAARLLQQVAHRRKLTPAQVDRLVMATAYDDSLPLGRVLLEQLLTGQLPVEQRRAVLDRLAVKLAGPWKSLQQHARLAQVLGKLLDDPALAAEALEVVRALKLQKLMPAVERLVASPNAAQVVREKALDVLVEVRQHDAAAVLLRWAQGDSPELRRLALRGLLALQDTRSLRQLLLNDKLPAEVRRQVLQGLMQSTGGALALLQLLRKDLLPSGLKAQVLRLAVKHPDANVRMLYQDYLPPELRPRKLGQAIDPEKILALRGDPRRGERIFFESSAAQCQKCHRVHGRGGTLGPNLSQIGKKYDRRGLLETILQPSKAIAPEYYVYLAETTSGHLHAGFLVQRTDREIVLRDANDRLIRIPAGELERLERQPRSMMPELVLQDLSAQDAADLLAFLETLTQSEVEVDRFLAVGPWPQRRDDALDVPFPPERTPGRIDLRRRFRGLERRELAWQTVLARPYQGHLAVDTVAWNRAQGFRGQQVVNYFAVWLESPQRQDATLLVGSDDSCKVWLNGRQVHRFAGTRALRWAQDQVQVTLQPGRNLVLLKVVNGFGPGGVSLGVRSPYPVQVRLTDR